MFLNGAKVGDNFLDPAWSDYDRQVCYQTFDISEELQPGGNVFGVMLGNGLYNVPRERYFKALISFGYPKMIFKAEIEYDSSGEWETAGQLSNTGTERPRAMELPLLPRRCDHFRLRISGSGDVRLHALHRYLETGSEL